MQYDPKRGLAGEAERDRVMCAIASRMPLSLSLSLPMFVSFFGEIGLLIFFVDRARKWLNVKNAVLDSMHIGV